MKEAKKPAIFVGFTTTVTGEPETYIEPPKAPSNYKDEEKIKEYEAAGWAKLVAEASLLKPTGRLAAVTAIDPQRKRIFNQTKDADQLFFRWLKLGKYDPAEVVIIGFGAREFMRLAGVGCLDKREPDVPLGFWYQHEDTYDPYDMLTEEKTRKGLSVLSVMGLFGIKVPEGWTAPHVNDQHDAILAYVTALDLQLLPPCVDRTQFAEMKFPTMALPAVSPADA